MQPWRPSSEVAVAPPKTKSFTWWATSRSCTTGETFPIWIKMIPSQICTSLVFLRTSATETCLELKLEEGFRWRNHQAHGANSFRAQAGSQILRVSPTSDPIPTWPLQERPGRKRIQASSRPASKCWLLSLKRVGQRRLWKLLCFGGNPCDCRAFTLSHGMSRLQRWLPQGSAIWSATLLQGFRGATFHLAVLGGTWGLATTWNWA